MKKSISVVIPNFNGRDLLQGCLDSVYSTLNEANIIHEVIVVDDASSDNSTSFIKEKFNEVVILVNEKNMGFSPTINRGIKIAKHELILLLNSDVVLMKDYFMHLFKYFQKEDTFGVCGRFIALNDGRIIEAGKFPHLLFTNKIQSSNFYVENSKTWIPTFYVPGGCALIDGNKLNILGGFDEIYAPFYLEDLDLSIRARKIGWKCYYEHKAICSHYESTTINKSHKQRYVWVITQRNKLILHSLHLSVNSKILWYMRQIFTLIFQALLFRWRYHEAFIKYWRKRPEIKELKLVKSENNQRNQKSLEEIMTLLVKEINMQRIVKI